MFDRLCVFYIIHLIQVLLLFLNQPALCANMSSAVEALPIGLAASEVWYVAPTAGGLCARPSFKSVY